MKYEKGMGTGNSGRPSAIPSSYLESMSISLLPDYGGKFSAVVSKETVSRKTTAAAFGKCPLGTLNSAVCLATGVEARVVHSGSGFSLERDGREYKVNDETVDSYLDAYREMLDDM